MKPALILIGILVVVGAILYLLDRRNASARQEGDDPKMGDGEAVTAGCDTSSCGLSEICPSQEILKNDSLPVAYYDDEELDRFAGREPDDYQDDEIEQWRDVLYTLQKSDLMGWGHSIQRRGLEMPRSIHDEFIMLYNER